MELPRSVERSLTNIMRGYPLAEILCAMEAIAEEFGTENDDEGNESLRDFWRAAEAGLSGLAGQVPDEQPIQAEYSRVYA